MASKQTPVHPVDKTLTETERHQMMAAAMRVRATSAEKEFFQLKKRAALLEYEVMTHRTRAAHEESDNKIDAELLAAQEALAREKNAADLLASDLAAKYAVDWKTAGYDPDTGRITQLPEA